MNTLMSVVSVNKTTLAGASAAAEMRQKTAQSGNTAPALSAQDVPQPIERGDLLSAVSEVASHFAVANTSLSISVDDQSGSTIIKVTDAETDEVIRQIPPEQIVNLARFLRENSGVEGFELADTMKGLLLDGSS